jgi:aminopeptidase N
MGSMSTKVRRLYEGFQPTHYDLTLEPDRDSLKITGKVVISGQKLGRPSQRLTFHQKGVKVTSATIVKHDKKNGDQDVPVARINSQAKLDEVRLHAEMQMYAGAYTVTMEFESRISTGMSGVYLSDYMVDGAKKRMISTQLESHHARNAFPCIDEPEAKATFDLTLISPAGEAAISNMPAKEENEQDGKKTTRFETTPKMSTYLLAFAFGDLQYKEAKTKNGIDVRVWSTKAHDIAGLDFALENSVRSLEFFEEYYDTPYPLPKCDHVAIPDFSAGAMENWGMITYREMALIAQPETTAQSTRELIVEVISHELSHQWFGNLVTMKWWDDLWLNESFANVMAYIAEDALHPQWHIWDSYIGSDGLAALRRDAIAGVQSIKTEVNHPDEISTLFDPSIVYAKGGRLIYMLVNYLGQDAFRKGLKQYFTKHAYSNTTGDDLWAALSEASGQDVAALMNPWLERSGYPAVRVNQTGSKVHIEQTHFLMDPAKADPDRLWPVPLLSDSPDVPALLKTKQTEVTLKNDKFVHLNDGALGHYVVQYVNPDHADAIAELARQKTMTIAERLMLLHDSTQLSRAGMQSFGATLQLLEYYRDEDSEAVWDIIALIIADVRRFIDVHPKLEDEIKALLRELVETQYQRLGWDKTEGEPTQDTKLRATITGLACYADHPEAVAKAIELFEAYKKDDKVVDAELRGIVFATVVRKALPGAFDYLLKLEETTQNVDLKQDLMSALTAIRTTKEADVLLGRLKDTDKVRQHDVDRWLVYLLRNRYVRESSWNWMRDNWGWIEETFDEDKSYDYFPRYAASAFNTAELLQEYKDFFGPKSDQISLARNIAMGIEELETRVAWLQRDVAAVDNYFDGRKK